jgi:hypothetical protein
VIFALSVQDFVDKIGAYVGFAAALGLALFALLLFAQARELKRLREWGAHAHDRIGELERRLAVALELARRASSPQRTMAPGAAQRAGGPAAVARPPQAARPAVARTSSPTRLPLLPAAPARVAGAALGSATVLVPLPKHPPGVAPAAAPAPATAPTPAGTSAPVTRPATPTATPLTAEPATSVTPAPTTPAPATAAAQGPAQPAAPAPTPVPATSPESAPPSPAAPAPAPPQLGANGHSDTFPPVPPVRRPAPPVRRPAGGPGRRPVARPAARPGQRPVPAAPLRARGPATATPRGGGNGNGHVEDPPHGRRRLALLLAGLGAIAVAAVAVLLLTGGGSDSPSTAPAASSGTSAQQTPASRQTPTAAAPAHDRITVAVLNGTPTAGLASTVATTLASDGFLRGSVTNASDQQRSVTVVSYFGGHEAEAREVAKTLNVASDAVQPIDADTEAACAQGATCTATAVVTVGADRQ